MNSTLRTALTILCVLALAWPLLFWGKSALPDRRDRDLKAEQPVIYNTMSRHDLLW
jgi:hypothetical protein